MTRLIVTADDFGASTAVNEAVERAHRQGILTCASLMVGAPAAADAVARARALPGLAVGLHLTLVRGRSVLPPARIPHLVDARGLLPEGLVAAGVRWFFHPAARHELALEIRAQFEAFGATGLTLDHVNAHNHMHLHPTVLGLVLAIGREHGLRAVRVPFEPAHSPAGMGARAARLVMAPWMALLRRRLARAGVRSNDWMYGLDASGRMDRARVLGLLRRLPADGVTEMYFHPAVHEPAPFPPDYRPVEELAALTDAEVAAEIRRLGIRTTTFGALAEA